MSRAIDRQDVAQDLIVLGDSQQIDVWCERLGCTAADLANAIGDVGFSAACVRERLRELKSERLRERHGSERAADPVRAARSPAQAGFSTSFDRHQAGESGTRGCLGCSVRSRCLICPSSSR